MPKQIEETQTWFDQIQCLFENALKDKKIKSELKNFGYSSEKISEGKVLFEKANVLFHKNFIEYNLENSDEFQKIWNRAYEYYIQLIHISRIILQKERNEFMQLGLAGPRKKSLSGWLSQANQFYVNALSNPGICKKLEEYGITKEKLEQGKKQLDTVEVAIVSRNNIESDTRKISLEFDQAIDNLESWIYNFNTLSRVIFENNPQLLGKLKIKHR